MNINSIKNETLHKLTANEIGELGLCNYGIGLYRGELKSRKSGWKTVKVNDHEIHFEGTVSVIEFIQIVSTGKVKEWAARVYRKAVFENEVATYEDYPMGIIGCDFIR